MDGEMLDFTHTLERFDRLVLLLYWADRCTIPEIERLLGADRDSVAASIERIRELASESIPVSSSTRPAANRDRLRPPLRLR